MLITAFDLKRMLENVPNDYTVWIEYPARYGLAQPEIIIDHSHFDGQCDLIEAMSYGLDIPNKRVIIYHHY